MQCTAQLAVQKQRNYRLDYRSSICKKTQEPIIKLLYGIATPVLRDKTDNKEARQEAIEIICRKSVPQINRTVSFVLENVSEPKAQKRTSECLQNELDLIEELHKRYIPTSLSSTGISTSNHWQFINNYRKEHRAKMNWTACYEAEKDIDLFGKYTSLKSVQAAYYRSIKKSCF
ncbi:hypothetical protein J3Q64DRAFT_1703094 [Phycomyces blakesleeanus]|uniref:Uncharacterized protein n=1 Tax=Phycomyces blakesleeanus TaxID=4837 RepID=A0ABR3AMY2_PHYBL